VYVSVKQARQFGLQPGVGSAHRAELEDAGELEAVVGVVGGDIHGCIIGPAPGKPKAAARRQAACRGGGGSRVVSACARGRQAMPVGRTDTATWLSRRAAAAYAGPGTFMNAGFTEHAHPAR
jgi:hypothetical protein